jgi:DNA invertase Pin-like site-specific DNA recombinase
MLTMDFVTDPGHWRERAKSIRVTAQSLDDDDAKVRMLKIAEGYEALSRQSEESRDRVRQIEDAERDRGERRHYMGRKPSFDRTQLDAVRDLLGKGLGISETAKQARVSRQTVYRIQADPAGAETALVRWRG